MMQRILRSLRKHSRVSYDMLETKVREAIDTHSQPALARALLVGDRQKSLRDDLIQYLEMAGVISRKSKIMFEIGNVETVGLSFRIKFPTLHEKEEHRLSPTIGSHKKKLVEPFQRHTRRGKSNLRTSSFLLTFELRRYVTELN